MKDFVKSWSCTSGKWILKSVFQIQSIKGWCEFFSDLGNTFTPISVLMEDKDKALKNVLELLFIRMLRYILIMHIKQEP